MANDLQTFTRNRSALAAVPRLHLAGITILCLAIATLALVAALAGLLYGSSGDSYEIVTGRGAVVEIDGSGIYRHDSIFKAGANRGTDVLTLAMGIPLLIGAAVFHQRGSLRATLVLIGALVYFLYAYASLALGTAYNQLFLLYVALFAGSVVALALVASSLNTAELAGRIAPAMPRRGPAIFMLVSGVVTLAVWLMDPVAALFGNRDPEQLESGATLVTHALDTAIIVPAAIAAGWMILRGRATGYLLAMSLLVLEVMLAPMIALQTAFQVSAGVTFTTAEIIGPFGGFLVIALLAIWVAASILRNVEDAVPQRRA